MGIGRHACGVALLLSVGTVASVQSNETALTSAETTLMRSFTPWPIDPPPDAGNEFSGIGWAEALGEQLFNDTSFSRHQNMACSGCHVAGAGFADGLPVAIGAAQHVRNTQGLLNVGLQRWFGWDGGTDSLWSASLRPILSEIEMDGDVTTIAQRLRQNKSMLEGLERAKVMQALPSDTDEAILVVAAKAIGAYVRTLRSESTPFDKFAQAVISGDLISQKTYPDSAKRGLKIFLGEANCHICHFGPNFSNGEFHDVGRPFLTSVGQVDPGRYVGIQRVSSDPFNLSGKYNGVQDAGEIRKTERVKLDQTHWGQWRTPSLRNLTLTSPYMHDGSLATLRDVIDHYADIDPARLHSQGESILKPQTLSDAQRDDLVNFLETLSPTTP